MYKANKIIHTCFRLDLEVYCYLFTTTSTIHARTCTGFCQHDAQNKQKKNFATRLDLDEEGRRRRVKKWSASGE